MNERGETWFDTILSLGGCCFVAAVFVAGYQIYLYLKHGSWIAMSVIDGFLYLTRKNPPPWLLYPTDWVGVHQLLDKTPLALGFVIFGILWIVTVGYLGIKLEEYQERKQREAQEKAATDTD